jgi:hypothetical protein
MLERARRSLSRLLPGAADTPAAPSAPSSERPGAPAPLRRPQRATPRNVVGQGPLVAAPGLRLGIVVIVRNEARYLEEWLGYHLALGVDHVFLYDNGSDDDLRQLVERHVNHGLLTLVHWPLPGGQLDAYSHALRFFGPSVDWLAFIDVDEFIVPLVDEDIPTFLDRFPDAADIRIPRVDFGFSGHRTPPDGLTIDVYTGVADVFGRDPSLPPRVKTIVQPRGVSAVGIHTATVADQPIARDERPVPTRSVRTGARDLAQINHYYTRSFEEFEAKRFRGSATGRLPRPAIPFDLPALREDVSARRFADRTEAMMARIRSLSPRPYRYGSELHLTQFPRSNDLGLFGEFAVANTYASATELVREPLLRLENRYEGIGFVGDVGGAATAIGPGWLSDSIHLPALLEHVRGRLESRLDPAEGPRAVGGGEELGFDLLPGDERRAYALGFVVRTAAPAELRLSLEHADGEATPPVPIALGEAGTYAGIVELDPRPLHARRAVARVRSEGDATLLDLFLVSYG